MRSGPSLAEAGGWWCCSRAPRAFRKAGESSAGSPSSSTSESGRGRAHRPVFRLARFAIKAAFGDVAESYSLAASDVAGIYFPVTDAWLFAWNRDPALPLYWIDGFHPSEQGSYLAALVIVAVLTGRSPVGMPAHIVRPDGHELSIPEDKASLLQDAAAAAVAAWAPTAAAQGRPFRVIANKSARPRTAFGLRTALIHQADLNWAMIPFRGFHQRRT